MNYLVALDAEEGNPRPLTRRDALRMIGAAAGACTALPGSLAFASRTWKPRGEDESFLDDLEHQSCRFFWEQGSADTGQVLDRSRCDLGGACDPRHMASIASTGFGLTALCIADKRGYLPHDAILERVRTTLNWHLNQMPEVHGFFYHFTDMETGVPYRRTELSSIDTSILLCGVLTAKAHFHDPLIKSLAQQIYERVDWHWMLNGGDTFSMGWHPETGFLKSRWTHYCELMMIYLLAFGSPSHPVSPDLWNNFSRPVIHFGGYTFISGNDPLFTHQYSQAWFDFRHKRDAYANYFENSVIATQAHKAYCLSHPEWYSNDCWGVTASDCQRGYTGWEGPPTGERLDGTVVPSAAAGSLPFLPEDCIDVLRAMREKWGRQSWRRYGFVDAFHPTSQWYDTDVLGINQGISVLMAENLRSGFVWNTFMRNPECAQAMHLARFRNQA